jgi:hypothetical protein
MKNIFLFTLLILAGACNTPTLIPESIYDSEGLSVITSSFNNKQQTISILYGNAAALKTLANSADHVAGEDYRLVTWKQDAHPLWFGSQINGVLKSIERISTSALADGSIKVRYELVQGQLAEDKDEGERVKFAFDQKLSTFP